MPAVPSERPGAPRRFKPRPLLALFALVVLTHGLLLGLLPPGVGDSRQGQAVRPLQVRRIVPLQTSAVTPVAPMSPAPEPTAAAAAATPARRAAAPPVRRPGAAAPASAAAALAPASPDVAVAASAPAVAMPAGADPPPPVYATRLPPAATLRYDLRRGEVGGSAELVWRPAADRYELTLEGGAYALHLIGWRSIGGFDGAGIAPERFVDRRRRDVRAANFRRDSQRITYSGPTTEFALPAGAQDRLSALLQLAAIVAADPARFGPGERISMFVTGARADADVWTFDVQAVETLELPAGAVADALRLRRQARRPYDTQVDLWLDPARSYLPVQLRLTALPSGDVTDLLLREQAGP